MFSDGIQMTVPNDAAESAHSVQVFKHPLFGDLRSEFRNDEPLFVIKDACNSLEIKNSREAYARLDEDEKGVILTDTPGGQQELQAVTFPGLLSLILGARKKVAREYKRWVTHIVLPSIHKRGVYATHQTAERLMDDPDFMIAAFQALKVERARRGALEAENATLKPKALFADAVDASDTCILVGELAKILRQNGVEMGQNRLFAWMRENGYLMKAGSSYNMPTQRSAELGLFKIKESTFQNPDGTVRITKTPKVTGTGQQHFINLFLGEGAMV